jgi:hypothetical protein
MEKYFTIHGQNNFLGSIFLMRNKMDEVSNEHWQQNCCEKLNKRNKME